MGILEKLKDLVAAIEDEGSPSVEVSEDDGSLSSQEQEEFDLLSDDDLEAPEDEALEEEYIPDSAVATWEDLSKVREARSITLLMQQELGRLEIEFKITKEKIMQQYVSAQVRMREELEKVKKDLELPAGVKYRFSFPKEDGLNGIFEKIEE